MDGVAIDWQRDGEGRPIFVVGSTVYYPRAFSKLLRRRFELVFIDGRHFMPEYSPDHGRLESVDLSTFAQDVERVREVLGYERIIILGHSIHGQIALEYAHSYRERVAGVVLIGAVPFAFEEFVEEADSLWQTVASDERKRLMESRRATLDAVLAAAPAPRSFAVEYDHLSPLYWADPAFDAGGLLAGLENGPAFPRLVASLPSREAALARLERIEVPILLILGKLDFVVPYTTWEGLLSEVEEDDALEYHLLVQAGHNPQTEVPEQFDPILIDWSSRL